MKLAKGIFLHEMCGEHMAVAVGDKKDGFNGFVKNNATAQFIFELLTNDVTEKDIVDAVEAKYDAPRDRIEKDVHSLLEQMRATGLIEE